MVLKLVCAQVMLTRLALRGAFTAGAVAGTAGVVGLCALRKRMQGRRAASPSMGEGALQSPVGTGGR